MTTTSIPVRKAQIAPLLRVLEAHGARHYSGRTFRVEERASYMINNGDLLGGASWDEVYFMTQVSPGKWVIVNAKSWMKSAITHGGQTETVQIPQNGVVAVRSVFCGKDVGWTFYVAPQAVGPALTSGVPLALLPAAGAA